MIKKLSFFLNKKQKIATLGITLIIFIGALLETLGVSAIIPVVQLMAVPNSMSENKYMIMLADMLGITSMDKMFYVMIGIMMAIYIIKNSYLLFSVYVINKFANEGKTRTQKNFLSWYLNRPYENFLFADTSVILRIIRADIPNIFAILKDLMQIATESMVTICLGLFLLFTDWKMTVFVLGLALVVTVLIMKVLKNRIGFLGRENQRYEAILAKWIIQSMEGIKIVKVQQKEEYFYSHYTEDAKDQMHINNKYAVFNAIPRLLLETAFICGILMYLAISLRMGTDVGYLVSVISAFAVAAFRILPSISRFNTYLANIAYYKPSLDIVYNLVKEEKYSEVVKEEGKTESDTSAYTAQEQIEIKDLTYSYPNTDKKILDRANVVIPIGTSIGIKGPSGSGKTTLIDIILGLLDSQSGEVTCDGWNINEHKDAWLSKIGYIPQNIYFTDGTIRANIAFGIEDDEIDEERVWQVLRETQMEEFVKGLPDRLDTTVGEQGVRISGGQKQRLGIARALYHDPEILLFDEATSALDENTETAIMEAIETFKGKKTMIIIAHRLRTIEQCDLIYEVRDGKIFKEK